MYANLQSVRLLAKNLKQVVSSEEIELLGSIVDGEIDARLMPNTLWPYDSSGADLRLNPPSVIVQIANLMTAGLAEQRGFAQVDGGESRRSSYGAMLYEQGEAKLAALAGMSDPFIHPDIEMDIPVRWKSAPKTFHPVSGFRHSRRTD